MLKTSLLISNFFKILYTFIPLNSENMTFYIKLYLATLVAFFAIDMFWLGLIARTFYKKQLGYLMAPSVNWTAAIIFYLIFIVGILVFVVIPGIEKNSLKSVIIRAVLFGLITYATYDLTNLATVKDWPLTVTIVDLIWGMVLTTLVSMSGFFAGKWLS
jgi:uncharacterized membrane protein